MGNCIQIRKTIRRKRGDNLLSSSSSSPLHEKINFIFFNGEEFMALKSVQPLNSNSKLAQRDAYYHLMSQLGQPGSTIPVGTTRLAGKGGRRPSVKIIVTRKQLSELLIGNGGKVFQSLKEIKVRDRRRPRGKWRPSLCSIPELL